MQRIGFVTCVRLGLSCMDAIYKAGGSLEFAATLHDHLAPAKSGRVYVDEFCRRQDVPLVKVSNVNDIEAIEAIREASLDWLFIVGWSQIARDGVLGATRSGVLGMHPTLLPEGRGRAAVPWAILKGLNRTGVTLFKMDSGVDSGPILGQKVVAIDPLETATTLYEKIERAHCDLIVEAWPALSAGRLLARPQDEAKATVWPGRKPEDGRLNLSHRIEAADRLVRAVTHPYPGAFIDFPWGRVVIWAAKIEQGTTVQLPTSTEELSARPLLPFEGGSMRLTAYEVISVNQSLGM